MSQYLSTLGWIWFFVVLVLSQRQAFLSSDETPCCLGAPVAQWVKRWPTDLAVPSSIPARGKIFSTVNGVPLHTAFHYHPSIVLIWLQYSWKGRKITNHPSILVVYAHGHRLCSNRFHHGSTTISYPQWSLTFLRERYLHRCREQSLAIRAYAMSAVGIDVVSSHT